MINIELQGQEQLLARFESMPGRLRDALLRKMHVVTQDIRNYIVTQKLSGQVVNKRTGNLQRSITPDVSSSGSSVTGKVFSSGDVKYAGILEYGGQTAPHEIVATKAQALAFMMGGKQVFFKRVNHPGSKIEARRFMRDSLKEETPYIRDQIQAAANEAVK